MLVTVIVVTYNSSKYVLETLESVYRQTYADIELIVSDDCSNDNTFELCGQWLDEHKNRFVRAELIQTPNNEGICYNYNYALKQSTGEWIKYIAGDDLLEDNCIERFVANIKPDTFLYTCITKHLQNETGEIQLYSTRIPDSSAKKQARFMLKYLYGINGPTLFIERLHLSEIGGFEEKYPMIEDWPIAIRFATNGWQIGIINEALVQWRIYGDSISHSNFSFAISLREAYYDYTMRYCWRYFLPLHQYHHWLNHWILKHDNDGICYKITGYLLRCFDMVNLKRKILPIPSEPYEKID
ncbi:MAG: glycosyltransferase family 2 protein [Bacteroidales bacterium]|nr:glycosyltransferase family 2 protein [Bacteroidales bacterium]